MAWNYHRFAGLGIHLIFHGWTEEKHPELKSLRFVRKEG